MSEEGFD